MSLNPSWSLWTDERLIYFTDQEFFLRIVLVSISYDVRSVNLINMNNYSKGGRIAEWLRDTASRGQLYPEFESQLYQLISEVTYPV